MNSDYININTGILQSLRNRNIPFYYITAGNNVVILGRSERIYMPIWQNNLIMKKSDYEIHISKLGTLFYS